MFKKFVLITIVLLLLGGCVLREHVDHGIASIEIVAGGGAMSVSTVELIHNDFYITENSGITLSVIVRDEIGAIMDRLAEWSATAGRFNEDIGRKTTYFPVKIGKHVVQAKVGDIIGTASVTAYGEYIAMSGNGEIASQKHAINFKEGPTDNTNQADMIVFNQYNPDTVYYSENSKIVFPNGFSPIDSDELGSIFLKNITSVSQDSKWINEIQIYPEDNDHLPIKGIVKNLDGSFTKVYITYSCQYWNYIPKYIDVRIMYGITDDQNAFPY